HAPRRRHVQGWVAGAQAFEVDDGHELASAREEISGEQIAVGPHEWSCPRGRVHRQLPRRDGALDVDGVAEVVDLAAEVRRPRAAGDRLWRSWSVIGRW